MSIDVYVSIDVAQGDVRHLRINLRSDNSFGEQEKEEEKKGKRKTLSTVFAPSSVSNLRIYEGNEWLVKSWH